MIRPSLHAEAGAVINTGTARDITIGYTIKQHEIALERREASVRADLERAFMAEKAFLRLELAEVHRQLADLESSFELRRAELTDAQASLSDFVAGAAGQRMREALEALGKGETAAADALFAEVEDLASATIERAAKAAFERGKLAEVDIRWADAAAHYCTAARLLPTYANLSKARELKYLIEDYDKAINIGVSLIAVSISEYGRGSHEVAAAFNNHGMTLREAGQLDQAEAILRESLDMIENCLGRENGEFATVLGNLGTVMQLAGRLSEAEDCHRKALSITALTSKKVSVAYATQTHNLAMLLSSAQRFDEAEALFKDGLAIDIELSMAGHPEHATKLHNLGVLMRKTNRLTEAENLFQSACEIRAATLGKQSAAYASTLNSLAVVCNKLGKTLEASILFREALDVLTVCLGDKHPTTMAVAANLAAIDDDEGL